MAIIKSPVISIGLGAGMRFFMAVIARLAKAK
jgi:hypothetical protein